MRLRSGSAKKGLWNSPAFFLLVIAILAGGCHTRPKDDDQTSTVSAGSQLSQTLVGKRVTVRGGLFRFKCGPGIQFDDGVVGCLVDIPPKTGLDDAYAQNYEKLVEATGILGCSHASTSLGDIGSMRGQHDHYFFEKKNI